GIGTRRRPRRVRAVEAAGGDEQQRSEYGQRRGVGSLGFRHPLHLTISAVCTPESAYAHFCPPVTATPASRASYSFAINVVRDVHAMTAMPYHSRIPEVFTPALTRIHDVI